MVTTSRPRLVALLALVATLLGWVGVAAPAQAIPGTSVTWSIRQAGIPDTVKLTNTSISGYVYQQSYQTTRNNVQKTCPPSTSYKLQVPAPGGMRFLAPGECRTWPTAGDRPVGLFRASYTPPVDPPPSSWPDATTTGYQGNPSSLPQRDSWRVTTPGAVIENLRIDASDGGLIIDAPNVTIRDVWVDAGIWGIDALGTADGLVIEDTTVVGGLQAGIGLDHPDGWLVQRVNLYGGNDGIKPGGSGALRDSFIHDLGQIGNDPHNDAAQFGNARGIVVEGNRMDCRDTSCIAMFGGQAQFNDVTIEGNLMGGAGYTIYAGGTTSRNIVIRNNTIGSYGYAHPVTDWVNRPGNVFEGNVFTDGRPVPIPAG